MKWKRAAWPHRAIFVSASISRSSTHPLRSGFPLFSSLPCFTQHSSPLFPLPLSFRFSSLAQYRMYVSSHTTGQISSLLNFSQTSHMAIWAGGYSPHHRRDDNHCTSQNWSQSSMSTRDFSHFLSLTPFKLLINNFRKELFLKSGTKSKNMFRFHCNWSLFIPYIAVFPLDMSTGSACWDNAGDRLLTGYVPFFFSVRDFPVQIGSLAIIRSFSPPFSHRLFAVALFFCIWEQAVGIVT